MGSNSGVPKDGCKTSQGEDLILDLKARIDFNFSLSLFFLLEAQWVQWGKSLLNQTGARLSACIELESLKRAVRSTPSSSRGQVGTTPPPHCLLVTLCQPHSPLNMGLREHPGLRAGKGIKGGEHWSPLCVSSPCPSGSKSTPAAGCRP